MIKRNPSQQRAIAHLSGPMMVLAGPGSGKTSVIVERTAYMINEGGISPSNILVVTFSRAAAKEMKERFLSFTGQQYTPVTFGTFHGVFYGILKQAYGFTAANILSDEEKFGILRELTLNYGGDLAEEGDFQKQNLEIKLSDSSGLNKELSTKIDEVLSKFKFKLETSMSQQFKKESNSSFNELIKNAIKNAIVILDNKDK